MNDGERLEINQKKDKNTMKKMEKRKTEMNLKEVQKELVEARQKRGWKETMMAARYKMQTIKKKTKENETKWEFKESERKKVLKIYRRENKKDTGKTNRKKKAKRNDV